MRTQGRRWGADWAGLARLVVRLFSVLSGACSWKTKRANRRNTHYNAPNKLFTFHFRNICINFRNRNFNSAFWSHVSHGKPKIVLQLPIDCPLDSSGPPTWTWHWILKRTKLVQWSVKRGLEDEGWKTCVCTKAEWMLPVAGRRHKDLLA